MVLTYGEPTIGNGYSTLEISWEQCYSMCYWDANCSLSYYYSSQCELYQYGNYSIKQLTSSHEKLIAVKRNLTTDTCPTGPTGTDSYGDNGVLYINRIKSDGSYWNITYSSSFQCDIRTKLFRRDNYWVCVGVQLFADCSPYVTALKACNESGWKSMTGPFSSEEMTYFLNNKGNDHKGSPFLWVDGEKGQIRDPTLIEYKRELLQHYPLNTVNCAYIGHSLALSAVSAHDCRVSSTYSDCWIGAACLKSYINVN